MARATSSLPVPVSPTTKMLQSVAAAVVAIAICLRKWVDFPTNLAKDSLAGSVRSDRRWGG